MTDLHQLAQKISSSSPAIKAFALEVADRLDPVTPPPVTPPSSSSKVFGVFDNLSTNYAADFLNLHAKLGTNAIFNGDWPPYTSTIAEAGGRVWINVQARWSDADAVTAAKHHWSILLADGKTHAVEGFYIADDTDIDNGKGAGWIAARSKAIKDACPGCKTVVSHYSPATIAGLVGSCDEIAVDYYPKRANGTFAIDELKRAITAAGAHRSGIIQINTGGSANLSQPTPAEVKAQLDAHAGAASMWVYGLDAATLANAGIVAVLKAYAAA